MSKILITGATGNIGFELIHFLYEIGSNDQIIAGVRDIEKAEAQFKGTSNNSFASRNKFNEYKNQAFEITGTENKSFGEVSSMINKAIEKPISYRNVNPLKFYRIKKRDGMKKGMIIVMILLHFLPKFQKAPEISDFYKRLTGKNRVNLKPFIEREKNSSKNHRLTCQCSDFGK